MDDYKSEELAKHFMLIGIQDWGQSEEERRLAVQKVVDAAGFKARVEAGPIFGGIWPKPCTGEHGDAATEWLSNLTKTMQRGEFNAEVRYIQSAIIARAGEAA